MTPKAPHRADASERDAPQVFAVSVEGGRATFDRRAFIEVGALGTVAVAAASCTDQDRTVSVDTTTATVTSPATTPAPAMFEDQFDGALADGWNWRSEDPDMWSLTATPGWLQITAVDATQNVLVRHAPQDPYVVTTALRFRPTSNFQFAGLIVGPDEANFLQLGQPCSPVDVPDICIGDGVYLDNIENNEMQITIDRWFATDTDVVYLRFVVDGDSYAGYLSEDGATWTLVGERTRSFNDTEIGLIAHQATEEPAVAEFDYITVTSSDEAGTTTTTSRTTSTTSTTVPPQEGTVPPGDDGMKLDIDGETYTLPCDSPIPAGATCTCNCVDVPSCNCVGDTGCSCVGHTSCSCVGDTGCSCVGDSSCATVTHYWYPN